MKTSTLHTIIGALFALVGVGAEVMVPAMSATANTLCEILVFAGIITVVNLQTVQSLLSFAGVKNLPGSSAVSLVDSPSTGLSTAGTSVVAATPQQGA